jgi:group I intron endonuclease
MNCVYTLTMSSTGNFYIGSTGDIDKRIRRHLRELRDKKHHNVKLQSAYDFNSKYTVETIECVSREEAYVLEDKMIKANINDKFLCNIGLSSKGGDNLTLNPDKGKIIQKMTDSVKKRYSEMSEQERKDKYGNSGEANGRFGTKMSEENKEAIRESNRKRKDVSIGPMSDKHKTNFMEYIKNRDVGGKKNPFYGRKHSEETRKKLREREVTWKSTHAKKVSIDGIIYTSYKEASADLKVPLVTVRHRCLSSNPKFKDWFIVS